MTNLVKSPECLMSFLLYNPLLTPSPIVPECPIDAVFNNNENK